MTPEDYTYLFLASWTAMFIVLFAFWAGYARGRWRALKDQIRRKKESMDSYRHL